MRLNIVQLFRQFLHRRNRLEPWGPGAGKKFVVLPGPIHSKYDGDSHRIRHDDLVSLYGVSPKDCVTVPKGQYWRWDQDNFYNLIQLRPRIDGDYRGWLERVLKARGWD